MSKPFSTVKFGEPVFSEKAMRYSGDPSYAPRVGKSYSQLNRPQLIQTPSHKDSRGMFFEAYREYLFDQLGLPTRYVQDNVSISKKGVVRGLHYQKMPYAQEKFVRVLKGKIFDVTVDLETKEIITHTLSAENNLGLFVPHNYAHGFQALEEDTIVYYKCPTAYIPVYEAGLSYKRVQWPIEITEISEKDKGYEPGL